MMKVIIIQKSWAMKATDHLPSALVTSEPLITKCNLFFMPVQLLLGKPTKWNHFIKHLKQGPCSCYKCSNDINWLSWNLIKVNLGLQTIQCLGNSCRLCRNWSLCYTSARFIQVCFSKFYLLCVKLRGHISFIHYSCLNGWNVAQGTHSIPPIHSKMTGFFLGIFW